MNHPRYNKGDPVRTKIVYGRGSDSNIWVEATIEGYHCEDNSYDLSVSNPETHRVCPQAVHVPAVLIQWLYDPEQVQEIMTQGYTQHEAHSALDRADSLESALHHLQQGVGQNSSFSSSESKETSPRLQNQAVHQLFQSGASLCNETASSSLTRTETPLIELPDDEHILSLPKRSITQSYNNSPSCTPPLQSPKQEDHRTIRIKPEEKSGLTLEARDDEFDYTITFGSTPLGFEIYPCQNNLNGCVGKRLNEFSKQNVYKGSLILACNDIWLLGQTTQYINQCIKAEIQHPPIAMTFRAKIWMKSDRARSLRKKIERSRLKNNKLKGDLKKDHSNSSTAINTSLNSGRKLGRSRSPTAMNTRINSGRKRKKVADEFESLRVFVRGGTFTKGITHVNFEINGDEKETKQDATRTTNPVYGETLIWKNFDAQEGNLLTCQVMNSETIFAIGAVRIPGDNNTLETVITMKEESGKEIGNLQVNITYLR